MNISIIGSSRGIGLSLVEYFRNQGHHVYGMARSRQEPRPNFTEIWGSAHVEISPKLLPESLDALIYCAGSQMPIGRSMELEPHEWLFGVRDNLFGAFNSIHACYQTLLKHTTPRGKIICFSGGGATRARANLSAYACAKAAIVRLVETLAEEWKYGTLDINALAPGAVYTTMTKQILDLPENLTGAREKQDALRTKNQDNSAALTDIHQCVEWLLSTASDGITGKLIAAKWDSWRDPSMRAAMRLPDTMVLRRTEFKPYECSTWNTVTSGETIVKGVGAGKS